MIYLSSYRRIDFSIKDKKKENAFLTLQFDDKHLYHNSSNNF